MQRARSLLSPARRRFRLRTALRSALALAALAAVAVAAGCGDDSDIVIVAITRTPDPVQPASTATAVTPLPPTAVTATATPAAQAQVPARPSNLLAGGNAVAAYLAGGGADPANCLPALVQAWDLPAVEGARCAWEDLDGDGAREFAFLMTLPPGGAGAPGDVWLFESADEGFRLFASARSLGNAVLAGVQILAAQDLTGDTLPELIVSSISCAAAVCTTDFLVVSAHRGDFEDLAPAEAAMPGLQSARVEDLTGDGRADLVLHGGAISSAGAGPQRPFERVLSWSGLQFLVREQQEAPRYLFHLITDADERFASADYAGARALYLLTSLDTSLRDWKEEAGGAPGRMELVPYALFRSALAALREGEHTAALSLLEQAFTEYPEALHGLAAGTYLARLQAGSTAADACRLVELFFETRRAEFDQIWDFGYANPQHQIGDICR